LTRFLRIFLHFLYHQFAWGYDWVASTVSLGQWNDWVGTALPYLPGPAVLETGFGPGHLQIMLQQRGIKAYGLDASLAMCRLAVREASEINLSSKLVYGYTQFSPFCAAAFDQVVATFPTEYIFHAGTLAEIRRVLKPGGCLVVIPFAWISSASQAGSLAAGLFRITHQTPPDTVELEHHLAAPFEQAGFSVEVRRHKVRTSEVMILLAQNPFSAYSGKGIN
jgi:ubiquinone/menaquinone biosynthesis C-methylase UbiE